jgi:hypothetical protein
MKSSSEDVERPEWAQDGDVNTVLNRLVQYKHTPEKDFLLPVR